MESTTIPTEYLFSMELNFVADNSYEFDGPFGRRHFSQAADGRVTGRRLDGTVIGAMSTTFGRASADGRLGHLNGYITILADDGTIVLVQVRGRTSPRYGKGGSRLALVFTVSDDTALEWLGRRQAIGIGRIEGDIHIVDVYALDGDPATIDQSALHLLDGELVQGAANTYRSFLTP